ncbi:N-formylglutamate amidohydrolase [Pelagibius sp. Alg239-R121]|uniref:N-formylglutamate amidohydrolase n=1 Tax=Pelagibius sp. Alg239-R121 TaxID=2993448 RepID=UPI0024A675B7|nr:N-formylglutamate amidohydrolase [Pelagibius sp. Alg239-R121]
MSAPAALVQQDEALLTIRDGAPFEIINPYGDSRIVLICEHASSQVPERLDNLGLPEDQLSSHIGWDPGARDLATGLSSALNAPLVAARFSRLIYDCNRPPDAPSAMPHRTEVCDVPGNEHITEAERLARAEEIYHPFHQAASDVLRFKRDNGIDPVVVTVHSFTPVFNGKQRSVDIGYLHAEDDRLSTALQYHSTYCTRYNVQLNQPYAPVDGVLHTIEKHLESGAFPYVMIEVRNDLLADTETHADILSLLSECIPKAVSSLDDHP